MKRATTQSRSSDFWTREEAAFWRATSRVQSTQEQLLRKILKDNSDTEYGRQYGFAGITSANEYLQRVPLVDYSAIASRVGRIAWGEGGILFPGRPLCLQPTAGTTSGSKMIPFTAALRKQFQRGVNAWLCDIWAHQPALLQGKSYWSVSPVVRERTLTAGGGIPLGFLDDAEYLTPVMAAMLRKSFAVPSAVGLVRNTWLFRYLTMAFLLKARDLAFVSVWNPTFFLLLLDSLRENCDSITADIARGELSHLHELPEPYRPEMAAAFGAADPHRASELRSLLVRGTADWNSFYEKLWPGLQLISCWEDAEAKGPAARLHELFPRVKMQPKGLMATEAMVSLPLHRADYPLLSLRSHFFEFIPVGNEAAVVPAWELEQDLLYEVVVTTAGGLYRYRLGDFVRIRGFYNDCPMLEFMGRGNHTSDFFGEKLHQLHVTEMINAVFHDRKPASRFALLAPDGDPEVDHYTLFVAFDTSPEEAWLAALGERLEEHLRTNFHYDYCRKLGQLKALEVWPVGTDVTAALRRYTEEMQRRGMREGDIKPAHLDNRPVWKRAFGVYG